MKGENIMKKVKILIQTIIILLIAICTSLSAHAAKYKCDELNRLVEVIYDSGQTVTYTYDAAGNILKVEVNTPLRIEPIGDKKVEAGQLIEFTVVAFTEEGTDIEYFAYNLPEGAEFDTTTNTFRWIPNSSQAGVHTVTFKAKSGDYTASETVSITVQGIANTLPGENVEVKFEENSSVTFENVTQAGETKMSIHDKLPGGTSINVNLIPIYYDITTTAQFEGSAKIKIYFDISGFEDFEEDLRLYQIKDGDVKDITIGTFTPTGTNTGYIEGEVDHFCYFAVGIPNRPPVADAGKDKVVKATSPEGAEVLLDASLSFDPDSELKKFAAPNTPYDGRSIVRYKWYGIFGEVEGISPKVTLSVGTWEITLIVSDGLVNSSDKVTITVKEEAEVPLYGDLNGDGEIDTVDLALLGRFVLGIINEFPSENGEIAADLNGDVIIDTIDYTLLKRYILVIIDKFPVENM